MTSQEIAIQKNPPSADINFHYHMDWLKEIAFHTARIAEKLDAGKKETVADGGNVYVAQVQAHVRTIDRLMGELDAANQHVKILQEHIRELTLQREPNSEPSTEAVSQPLKSDEEVRR